MEKTIEHFVNGLLKGSTVILKKQDYLHQAKKKKKTTNIYMFIYMFYMFIFLSND